MNDSSMPINWYPGHMAKTRRLLTEQIRKVDLVIELCDARLPYSSRNPEIGRLIGGRKHILLMNKCDLADPVQTKRWIVYFQKEGIAAYAIDAKKLRSKELLSIIQSATKENIEHALARGIRKTLKAMVVGVPNVGKSTVINALQQSGTQQTGDRPGVTRSNQWVHIHPYLDLMDTPGMLWPRLEDQAAALKLCYLGSISDDVVDQYMLATSLLDELSMKCPQSIVERFHLDNSEIELRGSELLDAVCRRRGWLLKGNRYDYDRGCSVILDEFRGGKLGRMTLEAPENKPEVETE